MYRKFLLSTFICLFCVIGVSAETYLVFDTEQKAQIALSQINENKRYPIQCITPFGEATDVYITSWAEVSKAEDLELWYFEKPNSLDLQGVEDYEESLFDASWLPDDGD